MSDYHIENEINGFWGDIKATEEKLSYERETYARRLKNGLGDDIISYLETPPKISKWKKIKNKIKKWCNK